MEPYIQPTWKVTYVNNDTGREQVITVGAEGREEAISTASYKVSGLGPWYFLRAERVYRRD
jgi:hypothetical protein